jgi:hypothetical protein
MASRSPLCTRSAPGNRSGPIAHSRSSAFSPTRFASYLLLLGPPHTDDWRDVGLADRRGFESTPSTRCRPAKGGWAGLLAKLEDFLSELHGNEEERKTESLRATPTNPVDEQAYDARAEARALRGRDNPDPMASRSPLCTRSAPGNRSGPIAHSRSSAFSPTRFASYLLLLGPPHTDDWRDVGLADRRGFESTPSTRCRPATQRTATQKGGEVLAEERKARATARKENKALERKMGTWTRSAGKPTCPVGGS